MTAPRTARRDWTRSVGLAAGAFFVAFGLWAMVAPHSFFDTVAEFTPYNRHFVQDIGAFQIGLGAVLLLAAVREASDALAVGLLGVGAGSGAHVVSHLVGHDLGGRPEVDIPLFLAVTVLLLAAGAVRWRDTAERHPRARAR